MWIEVDPEARAVYVRLSEDAVARTKNVIDCELLLDFGALGALVGIEVLEPRHMGRVAELLAQHGASVPQGLDMEKFAAVFSPLPAA